MLAGSAAGEAERGRWQNFEVSDLLADSAAGEVYWGRGM